MQLGRRSLPVPKIANSLSASSQRSHLEVRMHHSGVGLARLGRVHIPQATAYCHFSVLVTSTRPPLEDNRWRS